MRRWPSSPVVSGPVAGWHAAQAVRACGHHRLHLADRPARGAGRGRGLHGESNGPRGWLRFSRHMLRPRRPWSRQARPTAAEQCSSVRLTSPDSREADFVELRTRTVRLSGNRLSTRPDRRRSARPAGRPWRLASGGLDEHPRARDRVPFSAYPRRGSSRRDPGTSSDTSEQTRQPQRAAGQPRLPALMQKLRSAYGREPASMQFAHLRGCSFGAQSGRPL